MSCFNLKLESLAGALSPRALETMATQMVSHLEACVEFMNSVKHTAVYDTVCKQQSQYVLQQLSSLSLSVTDASKLTQALKAVPWALGYVGPLLIEVAAPSRPRR